MRGVSKGLRQTGRLLDNVSNQQNTASASKNSMRRAMSKTRHSLSLMRSQYRRLQLCSRQLQVLARRFASGANVVMPWLKQKPIQAGSVKAYET